MTRAERTGSLCWPGPPETARTTSDATTTAREAGFVERNGTLVQRPQSCYRNRRSATTSVPRCSRDGRRCDEATGLGAAIREATTQTTARRTLDQRPHTRHQPTTRSDRPEQVPPIVYGEIDLERNHFVRAHRQFSAPDLASTPPALTEVLPSFVDAGSSAPNVDQGCSARARVERPAPNGGSGRRKRHFGHGSGRSRPHVLGHASGDTRRPSGARQSRRYVRHLPLPTADVDAAQIGQIGSGSISASPRHTVTQTRHGVPACGHDGGCGD